MSTSNTELAEAFTRLTAGLAWLEDQPDGKKRAKAIRDRLASYMTEVADGIAGHAKGCEKHGKPNCAPCRSEQIAKPGYDRPDVWPPNPASDVDARVLGETP